jgi:hypothetical protein
MVLICLKVKKPVSFEIMLKLFTEFVDTFSMNCEVGFAHIPLGLKSRLCEPLDDNMLFVMLEFKLLVGFRLKLLPDCSSDELYPLWLDIKLENL